MPNEPRMSGIPELLELLSYQSRDHALILIDPRGRVTGWLAASEHVFGWDAAEMLGQPLDRMFTLEVYCAPKTGRAGEWK